MDAIEIRPGLFWVGVNDRVTDLFEGQWPLPHGVSYNAYLVVGKKVALIDSVKAPFGEGLLANIARIVDLARIAYVVVNHMEPDHSGALPLLRRVAPRAEILATAQAIPLLSSFCGIRDGVRAAPDGERPFPSTTSRLCTGRRRWPPTKRRRRSSSPAMSSGASGPWTGSCSTTRPISPTTRARPCATSRTSWGWSRGPCSRRSKSWAGFRSRSSPRPTAWCGGGSRGGSWKCTRNSPEWKGRRR